MKKYEKIVSQAPRAYIQQVNLDIEYFLRHYGKLGGSEALLQAVRKFSYYQKA